jgi:hypothetical protein
MSNQRFEKKKPKSRYEEFPDWSRSNGSYIAGSSALDECDVVARGIEAKWGADRLRLLPQITIALREKFDRQRLLLNQAIWHGSLEDVTTQAGRMAKAWRVLDKTATEAGAVVLPPTVWETALSDGRVLAVVRTDEDADKVRQDGRALMVMSLEEFALVVEAMPSLVSEVKRLFPGAKVTKTSGDRDRLKGVPMPEMPIDWTVGDDLPF